MHYKIIKRYVCAHSMIVFLIECVMHFCMNHVFANAKLKTESTNTYCCMMCCDRIEIPLVYRTEVSFQDPVTTSHLRYSWMFGSSLHHSISRDKLRTADKLHNMFNTMHFKTIIKEYTEWFKVLKMRA